MQAEVRHLIVKEHVTQGTCYTTSYAFSINEQDNNNIMDSAEYLFQPYFVWCEYYKTSSSSPAAGTPTLER